MKTLSLLATLALLLPTAACGGGEDEASDAADHGHEHGADDEHAEDAGGGHGHDEESLGSATVGDLTVELAQGHGAVTAGAEGHLVVKLPYSDNGSTIVRAWLGTQDRTLSYVGKGEYAPDHDDYDVHASAPDPLPEGVMWWIELEKPDGTRLGGSAQPILE